MGSRPTIASVQSIAVLDRPLFEGAVSSTAAAQADSHGIPQPSGLPPVVLMSNSSKASRGYVCVSVGIDTALAP